MATLPLPTRREIILAFALVFLFVFFWTIDVAVDEQRSLGVKLVPSDHGWPFMGSLESQPVGPAVKVSSVDEAMVRWSEVPLTRVVASAVGWSMLDNAIILNGTIFIVTDEPEKLLEIRMMISSGVQVSNEPDEWPGQEPSSKDMQIISPARALELFGTSASRIEGVSWLCNDAPQFLSHYYHFIAEITFGLWRTYSTLDPSISESGTTNLPAPRRMIFPHTNSAEWRDYSRLSTYISSAIFPSLSYEFTETWKDRAEMARPYIFDRIVISDRLSAMRSPHWPVAYRMITPAFELPGSPYWWLPIRRNLLSFLGQDAMLDPRRASTKPVITYISRQDWGRRMLRESDHEGLVAALERLRDQHGYELHIVSMDKITREEQLVLAARTTIMMGVHGNGLTHALWMQPSNKAALMEFFYPGGFTHDYEYPTRMLGIPYYAWWGDQHFDRGELPAQAYPEGFQGNEIPLDGEAVARVIHEHIVHGYNPSPTPPPPSP